MLSTPTTSSIVLQVFQGLEDFVEHELRLTLSGLGADKARTRTRRGCGYILVEGRELADAAAAPSSSSSLTSAALTACLHLTSRLPAVQETFLLVYQEQLAQDLLDALCHEAIQDGAKKLRREAHKQPLVSSKSNVEPGPLPWTATEQSFLEYMAVVWGNARVDGKLDRALHEWLRLAQACQSAPGASSSNDAPTFRMSFERGSYFFPLLRNRDISKVASEDAWSWLNGDDLSVPARWPVSLIKPDLDVTMQMIPELWTSGPEAEDDGSLTRRMRGCNPAGSLAILLRLPMAPASTIPSHRQNLSAFNDLPNSTAMLRSRAAALALTAILPESTFSHASSAPIQQSETVKVLEPCCGTGGLAVELADALLRRRRRPINTASGARPLTIFACDIDQRFADRTAEVFAASGFCSSTTLWSSSAPAPQGDVATSHSLKLVSGHVDSTDPKELADFVGGAGSVDLIMTDLPWGFRVLSKKKLIHLYSALLTSFLRVLKPGAFAYLVAAGSTTLLRALKAHRESQVQFAQRTQASCVYMLQAVHLPALGTSAAEIEVAPEGLEGSALREVVIGYSAYICVLQKQEVEQSNDKT